MVILYIYSTCWHMKSEFYERQQARTERDAECARAEVVQQDYLARMRSFTASYRRSFNFNRILRGIGFSFTYMRRT
jgi:hypothetical protein